MQPPERNNSSNKAGAWSHKLLGAGLWLPLRFPRSTIALLVLMFMNAVLLRWYVLDQLDFHQSLVQTSMTIPILMAVYAAVIYYGFSRLLHDGFKRPRYLQRFSSRCISLSSCAVWALLLWFTPMSIEFVGRITHNPKLTQLGGDIYYKYQTVNTDSLLHDFSRGYRPASSQTILHLIDTGRLTVNTRVRWTDYCAPKANEGDPLLFIATYYGYKELAKGLIERGADINAIGCALVLNADTVSIPSKIPVLSLALTRTHSYDTGLNYYSSNDIDDDRRQIAILLLKKGANANVSISDRCEPLLHRATLYNDTLMIKLLLEHGADPAIRDKDGKTALDYAKNKPEIRELLLKASAHGRKAILLNLTIGQASDGWGFVVAMDEDEAANQAGNGRHQKPVHAKRQRLVGRHAVQGYYEDNYRST